MRRWIKDQYSRNSDRGKKANPATEIAELGRDMERKGMVMVVGEAQGQLREGEGSCNWKFRTVQDAIDAIPFRNSQRIVIQVLPGTYKQPIYVPKTKNMITLRGFCAESTILTWSNSASKIQHHKLASLIGTGTFGCGSVIVEGEDFIAEGITFENSAPQWNMCITRSWGMLKKPYNECVARMKQGLKASGRA